jgi:hypothetical protein
MVRLVSARAMRASPTSLFAMRKTISIGKCSKRDVGATLVESTRGMTMVVFAICGGGRRCSLLPQVTMIREGEGE